MYIHATIPIPQLGRLTTWTNCRVRVENNVRLCKSLTGILSFYFGDSLSRGNTVLVTVSPSADAGLLQNICLKIKTKLKIRHVTQCDQ